MEGIEVFLSFPVILTLVAIHGTYIRLKQGRTAIGITAGFAFSFLVISIVFWLNPNGLFLQQKEIVDGLALLARVYFGAFVVMVILGIIDVVLERKTD